MQSQVWHSLGLCSICCNCSSLPISDQRISASPSSSNFAWNCGCITRFFIQIEATAAVYVICIIEVLIHILWGSQWQLLRKWICLRSRWSLGSSLPLSYSNSYLGFFGWSLSKSLLRHFCKDWSLDLSWEWNNSSISVIIRIIVCCISRKIVLCLSIYFFDLLIPSFALGRVCRLIRFSPTREIIVFCSNYLLSHLKFILKCA